MLRLPIRELIRPELQHLGRLVVQRNHATGAGLGLALADADGSALEVDLLPTQQPKLRVPHARVGREQDGGQQRSRSTICASVEQALFIGRCQGFAMLFTHREHADVRLQVRPEAMPTQDRANRPDLQVDGLRRRLRAQAMLLVAADVVRLDVRDERLPEHRQDVREVRLLDPMCLRRDGRLLHLEPGRGCDLQCLRRLPFLESVVALFELQASLPFRIACDLL